MFLYIVAYDIPSNRRRKKVSDILEGYGKRVQYSVFELVLAKSKYDEMRRRLSRLYKSAKEVMIGGRAWNWVVSLEGLLGKAFGLTQVCFGLLVGGGQLSFATVG